MYKAKITASGVTLLQSQIKSLTSCEWGSGSTGEIISKLEDVAAQLYRWTQGYFVAEVKIDPRFTLSRQSAAVGLSRYSFDYEIIEEAPTC
jgi:hypothetical protein